jgi:EAL domain-containing protein (putative c-di-GMP-specific phosphodiesterase class I)
VPSVSVNVSSRRLYDPNLIEKLSGLNIAPGEVFFELLESIFLDNDDDVVQRNLEGLRNMKIGIEIDDFGTGHASIVSLLKVAPNTLKVDRAVIQHASGSSEQRKLLSAIIEMGHALGITVLGEGVETTEQIATLQELDCDRLQGYALAKPMPASQLIDFINRAEWRNLSVRKTRSKSLNLVS